LLLVRNLGLRTNKKDLPACGSTLSSQYTSTSQVSPRPVFPRCMECQRGLAVRKLSVCLSVHPSVKRVHCDKTEERSVKILILYERSFSLVFWEEEWLMRATLSTWNFGSTCPVGTKSRFPMRPRWTPYVVRKPSKGWLKNAVSKIWTISYDNSQTVLDRMSVTIHH